MVIFSVLDIEADGYPATLLEFTISGDGTLLPEELPAVINQIGDIDGTKGVIVGGRGPVWLYGALLHHLHVTRWSATFDPRLGAVVVASHHPDAPTPGTVLTVPKPAVA
jgi:CRISPR-associated protein Csx3